MGAKLSSTITFAAECTVKYHYECEKCGVKTDYFHTKLRQIANYAHKSGSRFSVNLELNIKAMEKTEKAALRQLKKLKSALKEVLEDNSKAVVDPQAPYIAEYYNELFAEGEKCPNCKSRQSWYPADIKPRINGPVVRWGRNSLSILGAPEEHEEQGNAPLFHTWALNKSGVQKEDLTYWRMRGLEHENILTIRDVIDDLSSEAYSITEDYFNGTSLSDLIEKGISEADFQDYILQLCDALEFLHRQKPVITHNSISANNILIGKNNLLKLTDFQKVTFNSPLNDIVMVGELMACVNAKYIKRYTKIIENCSHKYQSIEDLRRDFIAEQRPKYMWILPMIAFVAFAFILLLRRVF